MESFLVNEQEVYIVPRCAECMEYLSTCTMHLCESCIGINIPYIGRIWISCSSVSLAMSVRLVVFPLFSVQSYHRQLQNVEVKMASLRAFCRSLWNSKHPVSDKHHIKYIRTTSKCQELPNLAHIRKTRSQARKDSYTPQI